MFPIFSSYIFPFFFVFVSSYFFNSLLPYVTFLCFNCLCYSGVEFFEYGKLQKRVMIIMLFIIMIKLFIIMIKCWFVSRLEHCQCRSFVLRENSRLSVSHLSFVELVHKYSDIFEFKDFCFCLRILKFLVKSNLPVHTYPTGNRVHFSIISRGFP